MGVAVSVVAEDMEGFVQTIVSFVWWGCRLQRVEQGGRGENGLDAVGKRRK